jgi:probable HAF family extracellular repeat protein
LRRCASRFGGLFGSLDRGNTTPVYPMENRYGNRNCADELWYRVSRVFLVLKSLGLIWAICFASTAPAQNRYQIIRIPVAQGANSAALGINNKGEVVGYSFQGEDYQAFLYSSSEQSLTDVGSFGGKINAACAINDAGQVTGYSQDGHGNLLAFAYSRKQPIASLGTLEGASTSEAFGINNSGSVVGDSQGGNQKHRPVLFSNGSIQDLSLGRSNEPDALETAYAINDVGQIVGRHTTGNNAFHAFEFVNGNTIDFGTLGGANGEALAINKNGVVVGDSDTADGRAHAFVFDHSQLKDLGTLPGFDDASYARGINKNGDIVGESDSADQKRAFIFAKGQLFELDKLAENLSEAGFNSLDVAYGINDKGWIVGYGTTSDNLTAAFVAVPGGRGDRGQAAGVPQPQGQWQAGPPQPQSRDLDQEQHFPESNEEDYDVFYTRLYPEEGNWVEAGDYGYCFRPRVSGDWQPYRDGHWVWTDRGWYWDSNEPFGWATYHYGRWVDIAGSGWCWIPGNQWAPAWVSWRESDEYVGWAPLPPEADVSVHQSISSWSDSYYGIGPAAYAFISYSHWREPSYARYIEPPERNVQIISETKNVTNIVTNNNVINNFGPPVQTVATKTNQNIQQLKLALNPATDPKANFGQTRQGTQLNVIAPAATLKAQATHAPPVQNRIESPQVEKGWHGVRPQDAEKLKKTIAEQNPPPKGLPKPAPLVHPQTVNKGGVSGSPGGTGSPTATVSPLPVAGQKAPPNLMKPGANLPKANTTPGTTPNTPTAGKKPIPPNLLVAKPSGAPGALPTVKSAGTPGGLPTGPGRKPTPTASPGLKQLPGGNVPEGTPSAPKGAPNLNVPRPSATPGQPGSHGNQLAGSPTPKPAGNLASGQNLPQASATPKAAVTPPQEKKPETTPEPTPHGGPANLMTPNPNPTPHQRSNQEAPKPTSTPPHQPANVTTPKPTPEVKAAPREISTPKPTPVSPPHGEPVAIRKPTPEVNASSPPKQEIRTPPPEAHHTPAPQPRVRHTPPTESPALKIPPPKQEIRTPPREAHHTPPPQPRVAHTAPAQPPARKAPPPKQEIKTPPPPVQHAPAPQPRVAQAPPARPPVQKAPPPQQPHQPQGGQKHEPAKGKPTPKP